MRAAATDSMALLCNGHSIRVSLRLGGGRYAVIGRVAGIAVGNGFAESRPRLGSDRLSGHAAPGIDDRGRRIGHPMQRPKITG